MGEGHRSFKDANTIAVEGGEDVAFKNAIIATGSFPLARRSRARLAALRRLGRPARADRGPRRLVILGGGIIGAEFASIFQRFGSEVTIIEMLPRLIPLEDEDASKELAKQFGRRGITLHLEKTCTKSRTPGRAERCTSATARPCKQT